MSRIFTDARPQREARDKDSRFRAPRAPRKNALPRGGDPRGAALIAFMNTQDASQLPGDFDLISPASLGAMFDLDFASMNLMSGNVEQRMSEIRLGNHEASGSK